MERWARNQAKTKHFLEIWDTILLINIKNSDSDIFCLLSLPPSSFSCRRFSRWMWRQAPAADPVLPWETCVRCFHGHSILRLAFRNAKKGTMVKLTCSAQQEGEMTSISLVTVETNQKCLLCWLCYHTSFHFFHLLGDSGREY